MPQIVRIGRLMGSRRKLAASPPPAWVFSGASLDIDNANNRAWGSGIGETTPAAILSVIRASAGFARNAAASFTSFSNDTLRRTDLGALIESASTQLVFQNISASGWSGAATAPITTGQSSPDGGTSAFNMAGTAASSSHFAQSPNASITTGNIYCASVFAVAGAQSIFQITLGSAFSGNGYANFDLSAGTVAATGGTLVASGIIPLGGGLYRCWIAATSTATAVNPGILLVRIANTSSTRLPTFVDATTTIKFWMPQCELGSYPSSPISNATAGTVTRAADNVTPSAAAQALMDAAKSAYAETQLIGGGSAPRIVDFAGTASLRASVGPSGTTVATVGASTATATIGGAGTVNGLVKSAFSFDGSNNTAKANGGTLVSQAGAWGVTNEVPTIGNLAALTNGLNGYLGRLAFSSTPSNFDALAV